MNTRKPYPSDVSDDEWALVAPYLTLLPGNSTPAARGLQWLRYVVKTGAPWRWMPDDLPPSGFARSPGGVSAERPGAARPISRPALAGGWLL
jgi:transposase